MDNAPIVILAHLRHPAVTDGFLPAAHRLGRPTVVLTDQRLEHLRHFDAHPQHAPRDTLECDVFDPLAVIDRLHDAGLVPGAVFSNSDHLQASTALVAQHFGLPGKDWRTCYAAKNKAQTRERLRALGLPTPWFCCLEPGQALAQDIPWPVVAKPREGVASMDVSLCANAAELEAYLQAFEVRHPGQRVLLERYLEGPLFTLETLGDGEGLHVVGGFDVGLCEPPHFIECQAHWRGPAFCRGQHDALAQVRAFGVGLGACHSEFVLAAGGPVLVEINYRGIGDGREFTLDRMYGGRWFESILRLHLGQSCQLPPPHHTHAALRYFVATAEGRLLSASDNQSTSGRAWQARYRAMRSPGDEVRLTRSNKDYLGVLDVIAGSEAALQHGLESAGRALHWEIAPATGGAAE